MSEKWKQDPATQKQIDALATVGIKCPPTKGEASLLISEQFKIARQRLASRKHGTQTRIGSGEVSYFYGVMDYCDDGNGNVFDLHEEYNDNY